jgi:hypothetical protein
MPLALPTRRTERWSMDFMLDTPSDGRGFRTLHIVDDFTRECVVIEVDRSLPGLRVVRVLDRLAETIGLPNVLVMDNGPKTLNLRTSHDRCSGSRGQVTLRSRHPGHHRSRPRAAPRRLFAVLTGVALVGLGYSVWRHPHASAPLPPSGRAVSFVRLSGRPLRLGIIAHLRTVPVRTQ